MHFRSQSPLPELVASGWSIICDFDGTITPFDVTDAMLGEFAAPEWEEIEQEWLNGKITARQCMESQIAVINAPIDKLDAFLDSVPLTTGFAEFSEFCRAHKLTLLVVSDGLDYSIKRILGRHGLGWIPVVSNRLLLLPGGRYRLKFPYGEAGCPSGVCKCSVAEAGKNSVMLIGDGLSDCCLGKRAQFIMARRGKELQKQSIVNNYQHLAYDDFFDIRLAFGYMLKLHGVATGQATNLAMSA